MASRRPSMLSNSIGGRSPYRSQRCRRYVPRDLGNGDGTPEYTYPVVVGVDGSFAAIRAARWAAAVAEKFAAPLLNLLHHSAIPVMICHSVDADG